MSDEIKYRYTEAERRKIASQFQDAADAWFEGDPTRKAFAFPVPPPQEWSTKPEPIAPYVPLTMKITREEWREWYRPLYELLQVHQPD